MYAPGKFHPFGSQVRSRRRSSGHYQYQRFRLPAMHQHEQQDHASGEAASTQGQNPALYKQESQPRVPLGPGQAHPQNQAGGNHAGDVNTTALIQAMGGLNVQNQRGGKYGSLKHHVPAGHAASQYSGQYMLLPNGHMFGGMPQTASFGQPPLQAPDQSNSLPYMPTGIYPGFVTTPQLVPGSVPGYTWPYSLNGDFSDRSSHRHASWSSSEDNHTGTPVPHGSTLQEYYQGDRMGYLYQTPTPPQVQQYVPYQMMKSAGGYILQDLDALVQQDPPIPRAVPAMWTNPTDLTLAKCLENREGITNVYIRGFLPETTDEMLHAYAARFGKIDRCKAIVDLDTGLCKGFGFVQFFSFDACENCIRGFFHLGYQASFAQKSRNSRLKDLEDKNSTNIYCTNVPMDWVEADLRRHFQPYHVVSEKISRDEKTGVSKEVGFARFETREIAEKVLEEFHNVTASDGVKLLLRFADTKAQKQLKHQSNERRAYRAGEYNYSVEMVHGSTPSPSLHRLQQAASHFSPNSQASFPSPAGVGPVWTPATSISPSGPLVNRSVNSMRVNSWSTRNISHNLDSTPSLRGRLASSTKPNLEDNLSTGSSKTVMPVANYGVSRSENASPRKENIQNIRSGSISPMGSRKEIVVSTPRSSS